MNSPSTKGRTCIRLKSSSTSGGTSLIMKHNVRKTSLSKPDTSSVPLRLSLGSKSGVKEEMDEDMVIKKEVNAHSYTTYITPEGIRPPSRDNREPPVSYASEGNSSDVKPSRCVLVSTVPKMTVQKLSSFIKREPSDNNTSAGEEGTTSQEQGEGHSLSFKLNGGILKRPYNSVFKDGVPIGYRHKLTKTKAGLVADSVAHFVEVAKPESPSTYSHHPNLVNPQPPKFKITRLSSILPPSSERSSQTFDGGSSSSSSGVASSGYNTKLEDDYSDSDTSEFHAAQLLLSLARGKNNSQSASYYKPCSGGGIPSTSHDCDDGYGSQTAKSDFYTSPPPSPASSNGRESSPWSLPAYNGQQQTITSQDNSKMDMKKEKNRQKARRNRQKKKTEYMQLNTRLMQFSLENESLREDNKRLREENEVLKRCEILSRSDQTIKLLKDGGKNPDAGASEQVLNHGELIGNIAYISTHLYKVQKENDQLKSRLGISN